MTAIQPCPLPPDALLRTYADAGAYTDCFATDVARAVSQAEYVEAFYLGGLFRIERWLLALFVARPSTDAQVRALAAGDIHRFAAWSVEGRSANQLLMCDMAGRTRSWLMTAPAADGSGGTRLYFGSAVVPATGADGGRRLGFVFDALLGFHKLYSRALLRAARERLARFSPPS
jgi:hypothetical protein